MVSLTCLLSLFAYFRVNAYTKSTDTPIRQYGAKSALANAALSSASCPSSSPTMTDCGLVSGDPRFHGSYLSNGECIARNGKDNANGVRAFAHCVNNDYTCTYHEGPKSDIISTIGCTDDDQLMISCLPHNNIGAIHGAYVGTQFENTTIDSDTLCTAHHEQDGHGGWAKGICCKYNGND
eukprot:286962_1